MRGRGRFARSRRHSPFVRGVARLSILLMLAALWRPAWAVPAQPPALPPSAPAAAAGGRVMGRLAPADVTWLRPEGVKSVAVLFDSDSATSLRTGGEALVRVALASRSPVRGIGL